MHERAIVLDGLSDIYSSPELVMGLRIGALGGRTPDEAIEAGDVEAVMDWIEILRSGAFS
ncbi:MAG TPA: hypothetical protein VK631_23830 [Solirubrobacteraceae bacterium]|nr:hypothetical protein [Solirubrobacteraceae bacterium]